MTRGFVTVLSAAFLSAMSMTGSAIAAPILTHEVQDLADGSSGDVWEYTFVLQAPDLAVNQGIIIYFDYATSGASLVSWSPDSSDSTWGVLTWPADDGLTAGPIFDALSLAPHSAPQTFVVRFVWTGANAPGAQEYALYEADAWGNVTEGDHYYSQPATTTVPEPGSLASFVIGLSALWRRRRAKSA